MTNDEAIKILRYSVCEDSTGRDCGKYSCVECKEPIKYVFSLGWGDADCKTYTVGCIESEIEYEQIN